MVSAAIFRQDQVEQVVNALTLSAQKNDTDGHLKLAMPSLIQSPLAEPLSKNPLNVWQMVHELASLRLKCQWNPFCFSLAPGPMFDGPCQFVRNCLKHISSSISRGPQKWFVPSILFHSQSSRTGHFSPSAQRFSGADSPSAVGSSATLGPGDQPADSDDWRDFVSRLPKDNSSRLMDALRVQCEREALWHHSVATSACEADPPSATADDLNAQLRRWHRRAAALNWDLAAAAKSAALELKDPHNNVSMTERLRAILHRVDVAFMLLVGLWAADVSKLPQPSSQFCDDMAAILDWPRAFISRRREHHLDVLVTETDTAVLAQASHARVD